MPFTKGQSGNPHGRTPGFRSFRDRAQRFMDSEGVDGLVEMANGEGEDRRFALKLLTEYAYGKPTQPISGDPDAPALVITVEYKDAGPAKAAPRPETDR